MPRSPQAPVGLKTTYPPRRPVRRKRRPPPWISLRRAPCQTPNQSLRASAFQTDRGRLRYIEPIACAHPCAIQDGAETPSTISLKQASTIAEIRTGAGTSRAKPRAHRVLLTNWGFAKWTKAPGFEPGIFDGSNPSALAQTCSFSSEAEHSVDNR